jgi:hypothetical protein
MPSYGQHGNALRHRLVLENQELIHLRQMDARMQIHVRSSSVDTILSSTKDGTKYGIAKEAVR